MVVDTAQPQNLTTFDEILKDMYIGPIRDILNSKTVLLSRFDRDQENISGRNALIPIRVGRNEGQGAVADGARMPDPGRQRFDRVVVPMRYYYHRILFTGPTVAASRNSEGAFARVVDSEIRGAATDTKNEWNRYLHSNGTGRLAQIAAIAATIYTVTNPGGFANPGPGIQYLRENMVVGCFDEISGAFKGSATITAVDVINDQITLSTGITGAAADDFFYRVSEDTAGVPGSLPAGSWGRFLEPTGLAAAVDEVDPPGGAYMGIAVADTPNWAAPVIDNNGTAIPLDLDLLQMAEDASDLSGDGKVTLWIHSHGIRRAYYNLLVSEKRYPNTMKLDGGWDALEFNGKPMVPDRDAIHGRIYGVDEDAFAIYQMSPIYWVDDDGHILHRLQDVHAFQAALAAFWELGCTGRNRSVQIQDLQDAA